MLRELGNGKCIFPKGLPLMCGAQCYNYLKIKILTKHCTCTIPGGKLISSLGRGVMSMSVPEDLSGS